MEPGAALGWGPPIGQGRCAQTGDMEAGATAGRPSRTAVPVVGEAEPAGAPPRGNE